MNLHTKCNVSWLHENANVSGSRESKNLASAYISLHYV